MTKYSSADVGFYLIGGYDILGAQTTLNVKKGKLTEESHTLGDAWVEHESVGLDSASVQQEGFYDDDADGNNDALLANPGLAQVMCVGQAGNVIGRTFTGFAGALQADYERQMSRGTLHKARALHQGAGAVEEGVVLHTHSTETADGDTESTAHDNTAGTSDGGAGYLQVSALTLGGYTSVTVKVRHSTDDISYADLLTFTAVTAAPAAERKAVSGTVNRYTATSWAFNGSGSSPSVKFLAGFYRA